VANYYTRSVITDTFLLSNTLVGVLKARSATVVEAEKRETILDGLVNERIPLTSYYITCNEGWSDLIDSYSSIEEWAEYEGEDLDELSDDFKELIMLDEPYLLREILKLNPGKNYIERQSGWSCDKMRLDGFGGSSLTVTKKGYLYVTTTDTLVTEDGEVRFGGEFYEWDQEPWKDDEDEQSEAA